MEPVANKPYSLKLCWLLPSSIRPEFNKSANSLTDLIPSPGSDALELILIVFALASVILKEENPFISASEIENIADDWLPNELKFIELVLDGIVVIGPSFKNDVAIRGFVDEVNTSWIFVGKLISFSSTAPNKFKFTSPILLEFLEIKFLEAAAKSSGFFRLNFIAPDFDVDGDISKPSPSWGVPLTITW